MRGASIPGGEDASAGLPAPRGESICAGSFGNVNVYGEDL